MVTTKRFRKEVHYPRPHSMDYKYGHGVDSAVANFATIIPIAMYDEGLGSPSSYNANNKHASFATSDAPNCYPNSKIEKISTTLEFELSKSALETDNLHVLKVAFMPLMFSFKEDLEATDELTSETIATIFRMQKEATDRQCYPLWSGIDMKATTGHDDLPASVPGLTASQQLEAVNFDPDKYYNGMQYYSIDKKIMACNAGLKWITLTRKNPVYRARINIKSKSKYMNPYTFFGLMTFAPQIGYRYQSGVNTDTTDIVHINTRVQTRYNEWHPDFNMDQV